MAWLNSVTRSVADGVQGLATGVWAVVATPFVYTPLRPVTKQAIKGGLWIARGAQSIVEMTRAQWRDVVAEAQEEAREGGASLQLEPSASAVSDAKHTNGEPDGTAPERSSAADVADASSSSDITEVKGIGNDYARLLRAAGIASINQLAAQDPESLRTLLREANETHEVVGRVPSTGRIRGWIERAGERAL